MPSGLNYHSDLMRDPGPPAANEDCARPSSGCANLTPSRIWTADPLALSRCQGTSGRPSLSGELMIQLASSAEGIRDGEHEDFGERDTLDQEKRTVSAEYP